MADTGEKLVTSSAEKELQPSAAAAEQLEKLSRSPEAGVELSPRDAEQAAEQARVEALESAISVESGSAEKRRQGQSTPRVRKATISKKDKEASFKKTIKEVQKDLPPVSRTFSKVVHNRAVEKASDVVGSTIARPNAMLAGAVSAFIVTLGVYVIAKTFGYPLSGFESIGAFIIGWIVGVLFDYFRVLLTGKR